MTILTHNDMDGWAAAAIILKVVGEADVAILDHGDYFPWDRIEGKPVIMTDFSLPSLEEMGKLVRLAKSLVVIDHHAPANRRNGALEGVELVLDSTKCAAMLAWQYYFPGQPAPRAVRLVNAGDLFLQHSPNWVSEVIPFMKAGPSAGLRDPSSPLWGRLLEGDDDLLDSLIERGKVIMEYDREEGQAYAAKWAFDTEITIGGRTLQAIALCSSHPGAGQLSEAFVPSKHDVKVVYTRRGGKWVIAVYGDGNANDLGALCTKEGGGGHPGAAGFQCSELPFKEF